MTKTPELQRRHFCFIAKVLAEMKPPSYEPDQNDHWRTMVNAFIAACRRSNGRFNPDRFEDACNGR